MSEIVFLVEDAAEGGLVARALGHSIHTDADSYDELRQQVRDAWCRHFTASLDDRRACQMLPARWSEGDGVLDPEVWIDDNDHVRRIRVHA